MAGVTIGTLDGRQLSTAAISSAAGGDLIIVTGVAAQVIRVYKIFFVVTGATSITFKDGTATSLSGAMALAANGALTLDMDGTPWFTTTAGNSFVINSSAGTLVAGQVYYTIGPLS